MASYLATSTIGEFDLRAYREDGIRYWDALDPDLLVPPAAAHRRAIRDLSGREPSYKRLTRTISVPADGAQLSFWVTRDTEPSLGLHLRRGPHGRRGRLDHAAGPQRAHQSGHRASSCPFWLGLHPFLAHYQTDNGDGTCAPTGTTGEWWAASGASDGYEQWTVDLSRLRRQRRRGVDQLRERRHRPGRRACSSTTSTCPPAPARPRSRTTATPSTAGRVPGAPEGSEPNSNDWIVGTVDDTPPTVARSRTVRSPASLRSSSSCPTSSAATRSPPPAASSTTSDDSASRWRTRPARSTPGASSATPSPATASSCTSSPTSGTATAWPSTLAAHLAQRGFRDVRRVAVERTRGARDRAGDLRLLRRDPGRRPVLVPHHRRPWTRRPLRPRRLHPRGDDPARAAACGRRR